MNPWKVSSDWFDAILNINDDGMSCVHQSISLVNGFGCSLSLESVAESSNDLIFEY